MTPGSGALQAMRPENRMTFQPQPLAEPNVSQPSARFHVESRREGLTAQRSTRRLAISPKYGSG